MENEQHHLVPGTQLGKYRLQDTLGEGGFGITYRAFDTVLELPVAIKEYLPLEFAVRQTGQPTVTIRSAKHNAQESFRYGLDRFLDEARTLARFKSPHIVRVSDFFEANGTAYLVMDYEEGESLATYLNRVKILPEAELLSYLIPVLQGLNEVHQGNTLHRDIKPGNIYLRKGQDVNGRARGPMLIDFGAARVALGQQSRSLSSVISAGFSAPEAYLTETRFLGPWTDLYSIGATAYACMTGLVPVDANTRKYSLEEENTDPLPPLSREARNRYSADLITVVTQLLEIKRQNRPQSVQEVLNRLTGTQQPVKTVLLSAEEKGMDSHAADVLPANPAKVPEPVVLTAEPVAPAINAANSSGQKGAKLPHSGPGQRNILAGAIALVLAVGAGGFYLGKNDTSPVLPPVDTPVVNQPVVEPVVEHVVTPPAQPLVQPVVPSVAQPVEQTETVTLTNSAVADSQATQPEPAASPSYPVQIRVHPADANVVLDYLTYRADMTRPAGRYELRVEKAGYKPYLGTVEVEDHVVVREINLAPMTYGLTINTTPATARVRILNIGPAYTDGIQLAPGEYHLEVSARGYETKEEWVTLNNRDVTYNMVLEKKKDLAAELGLEFVTIPAGSFMMGSNDGDGDEKPVHRVQVPSFKLMKYEVTQGQWQAVMGANPSYFDECGQNCPVERVSWEDVQQFIQKLNLQTGLTFRLPSEAEWEYAARAGTTTAFAFGDRITTDQANFNGNYTYNGSQLGIYREKTVPVDSFQPNAWGLYNMHGNVWEWTEDCWNDSHINDSNSRARSDGDCSRRVLRGGSWLNTPDNLRSAIRSWNNTVFRVNVYGFRLVQGR